jgi:uncharacterized protein YqfA (UPF0365 family)
VGWALFRLAGPWVTARANGVPLSLLELFGMRMRGSDVDLIVATAVTLTKLGEPVVLSEIEVAYLSAPNHSRNLTELMRSVRPQLVARLELEAKAREARRAP